MDLVNYAQDRFDVIVQEFQKFSDNIGLKAFTAIPISGLGGDNIALRSNAMGWYQGPALLAHLESVDTNAEQDLGSGFVMPVQWVNRPNADFRGFSGQIISGQVRVGDRVRVVASGKTSEVSKIVTFDGALDAAQSGQSVTLCLADEIDCSRGDVISKADEPLQTSDQFEVSLIWMGEDSLVPGRAYWLKLGTTTISAQISTPKYVINVNNLDHLAAKSLSLNDIGVATLSTDRPIVFTPYEVNKSLGGFILIDKITNATIAAGLIHFSLRRAQNIHRQAIDIDRQAHANLKNQKPAVLWFTGLSGAGKSTIANRVEKKTSSHEPPYLSVRWRQCTSWAV